MNLLEIAGIVFIVIALINLTLYAWVWVQFLWEGTSHGSAVHVVRHVIALCVGATIGSIATYWTLYWMTS